MKRPIDVIARYGGEEFVVILPGTDQNGARLVGERFIDALKTANIPHEFSDSASHVSVSIGAAEAQVDDSAASLLQRADEALYQAKKSGRNRVC